MPLTSQQRARLQAKALTFMTESADIRRLVNSSDEMGVPTQSYAPPHATGVACRVIDARSRTAQAWREIGQTDAMVDMYRIVFPVGTDVDENCQITVGTRVYHVVQVTDDRTDAVDLQVHVKRIRGNDNNG